ncbi:hypothetical protein F4778DRAFT_785461 [Xylariomycetidae sp. FL2044]|nr:hypothetical protein F4778DRAFT_785461 [Xylariomycetidae sp. FL2044]
MAAVATLPMPIPPAGVPAQGGSSTALAAPVSAEQEQLLQVYRQYVTTGPMASDITEEQLKAAFQAELVHPHGQLGIHALCSEKPPECRCWPLSFIMTGTISFTPITSTFALLVNDQFRSVKGITPGAFSPSPLGNLSGMLYLNDLAQLQGNQYTSIGFTKKRQFFIDFYPTPDRSEAVARFLQDAPPFWFYPYPKNGTCQWVVG